MGNNKEDIGGSPGRPRGHSMLSMLKIKPYGQVPSTEFQQAESYKPQAASIGGINEKSAFEITSQRPSVEGARGHVMSENGQLAGLPEGIKGIVHQSTHSALTMAFQQSGEYLNEKAATIEKTDDPFMDEPIPRSKPITIKNSNALPEVKLSAEDFHLCGGEVPIRAWCEGLPGKKSFLGGEGNTPPMFRMSRRSTLADKPELDALLRATMINYDGHRYLPLTATTLHRLSPYWKGVKPIADVTIFNCLMLNRNLNHVHADHVVAAMERIGEHVSHILVFAPIHTSELGNVFNREAGNISPGNDWDHILKCFPNLKWLMFIHPQDCCTGTSCDTYNALVNAVSHRQQALSLERSKYDGTPLYLSSMPYNTTDDAVSHLEE